MTQSTRVRGGGWLVVMLLGASCTSSGREFGGSSGGTNTGGELTGDAGDATMSEQGGSQQGGSAQGGSGEPQAGSSSGRNEPGLGGGGASSAGEAGAATGSAGAGGGEGIEPEQCPAFSCCISGKVFDANAVSPLNACDVCKPASSTSAWTAANGQTCATEQGYALSPQAAVAKNEVCATNCGATQPALMATMKLSLYFTGSQQSLTSHESFVELDFSNIAPSAGLSVSNATLELHAEPDAPTAEQRYVTVRRVDVATQICKLPLPTSGGLVKLTCDVTAAVKSWLASPADAKRALKISYSGSSERTISLRTPLASDGTERPALFVDYSGKCQGNVCPPLGK